MTVQEQVDKIMEEAGKEYLLNLFAQMEYEYKVFKGILPMPKMEPLKLPFFYKKDES